MRSRSKAADDWGHEMTSSEICQIDQEERLARLALYLGLKFNPAAFHRVIRHTGLAVDAFHGADLSVLGVKLPTLLSGGFFEEAQARLKEAGEKGLDIVVWGDDHYPERLMEIPDPPPVLWIKGLIEEGDRFSIGLVGSRQTSPGGLTAARKLAREGAAMGLSIVSGLAKGVDAQAHWGALEAGGRTLAVLGSGLDWRYPKENARLYAEIPGCGAIISEFPPEVKPLPVNFPKRNRIIAGLSLAVVVVEAGERSGALITARHALEMNREVMALPGAAGSAGTRGGHKLIKDGAALVESMAEVVAEIRPRLLEGMRKPAEVINPIEFSPLPGLAEDLKSSRPPSAPAIKNQGERPSESKGGASPLLEQSRHNRPPLTPDSPEKKLVALLAAGPKDIESLVQLSGLSVSSLSLTLLKLELAGHLIRLESGLYQAAEGTYIK